MKSIPKPQPDEHAAYASMYINLLPDDGMVLKHLEDNLQNTIEFIRSFPDEKLSVPHEEDEWTIKEVLVHVIDNERIFTTRALRVARNDMTELPGYDQNAYVPNSGANDRPINAILEEFIAVRNATLTLFNSLGEQAMTRKGSASGNPLTARAAAYFIAGHELHHVNSIKENYT